MKVFPVIFGKGFTQILRQKKEGGRPKNEKGKAVSSMPVGRVVVYVI